MKTMTRVILIALLVLPFAACKKAEAPQAAVKAPMSAPTTNDRQAWVDYLNDVVPRNMTGIANQPYVYLLPGTSAPVGANWTWLHSRFGSFRFGTKYVQPSAILE